MLTINSKLKRSWNCVELGGSVQWTAPGAMVQVLNPSPGLWTVDVFEDGQWIGQDRDSCRSGALVIARRWVKVLTRPLES